MTVANTLKAAVRWVAHHPKVTKVVLGGSAAVLALVGATKVVKSLKGRIVTEVSVQAEEDSSPIKNRSAATKVTKQAREEIIKVKLGLAASRSIRVTSKVALAVTRFKRPVLIRKGVEAQAAKVVTRFIRTSGEKLAAKKRDEQRRFKAELKAALKGRGRELRPGDTDYLERAVVAARGVCRLIGKRTVFSLRNRALKQQERAAQAALENQISMMELTLGHRTTNARADIGFQKLEGFVEQVEMGYLLTLANIKAKIEAFEAQLDCALSTGRLDAADLSDEKLIRHTIFATKQWRAYQIRQGAPEDVIWTLKARIESLESHFGKVADPQVGSDEVANTMRPLVVLGSKIDQVIQKRERKALEEMLQEASDKGGFRALKKGDHIHVYRALLAAKQLMGTEAPVTAAEKAIFKKRQAEIRRLKACLTRWRQEETYLGIQDPKELKEIKRLGLWFVNLHQRVVEGRFTIKKQALLDTQAVLKEAEQKTKPTLWTKVFGKKKAEAKTKQVTFFQAKRGQTQQITQTVSVEDPVQGAIEAMRDKVAGLQREVDKLQEIMEMYSPYSRESKQVYLKQALLAADLLSISEQKFGDERAENQAETFGKCLAGDQFDTQKAYSARRNELLKVKRKGLRLETQGQARELTPSEKIEVYKALLAANGLKFKESAITAADKAVLKTHREEIERLKACLGSDFSVSSCIEALKWDRQQGIEIAQKQ